MQAGCKAAAMGNVLLFVALALVLIWTARLAKSKGRNPWLWVGAAFGLMLIPNLNLLAIIPMIILLFFKNTRLRATTIAEPQTCPRCSAPPYHASRFCTNCGWELSVRYSPDATDAATSPTSDQSIPQGTPTAEAQKPVDAPAPRWQKPGQVGVATQAETDAREVTGQVAEDTQRDVATEVAAEAGPEPTTEAPVEAPAPESILPKKPVPVDAPTAAGMTERGVRLYNQGRVQESIDQFTKAIALDPTYGQAWARRAEAYAAQGRGEQAEEDRRKLETLNAGSPGS